MKNIQAVILDFLDTKTNVDEFFVDHINIFNNLKISNKKHEFKSLLYLISKISNGHYGMRIGSYKNLTFLNVR